jgi:polyphosphate kinase 2 (PPK2 family)
MAEFSIGQRNAFAKIFEGIREKVKYMSRLEYAEREEERKKIGAKFGLTAADKRVLEIGKKIDAVVEGRDIAFKNDQRQRMREINRAIAELYSCETAKEAEASVRWFTENPFGREE